MLSITQHKGFRLTFANGWTVSVQFGGGNYCRNRGAAYDAPDKADVWQCENAEIAAWDSAGNWARFDSDDVKGWQSANDVAAFIAYIAGLE